MKKVNVSELSDDDLLNLLVEHVRISRANEHLRDREETRAVAAELHKRGIKFHIPEIPNEPS